MSLGYDDLKIEFIRKKYHVRKWNEVFGGWYEVSVYANVYAKTCLCL